MNTPEQGFSTRAIHGGHPTTGATIGPILDLTHAGPGQYKGYEYLPTGNPMRNALETCLAALEGGERGLDNGTANYRSNFRSINFAASCEGAVGLRVVLSSC
jgi:cystathionine beta-lyase/cystathionine gamma-synthase